MSSENECKRTEEKDTASKPDTVLPREPSRRRRTRDAACAALQLCVVRRRARPLSRLGLACATPATYEEVSGGARTTSSVVRRTSALGAGSFW